jgi:glutamyl-tRNA reductase
MQLRGAGNIVVSSRTAANAGALAAGIGAATVPFDDWQQELHRCDIVIFCAAAQGVLLRREDARSAMARRHTRPLFLIDLAMPLDVEPSVAELPDVFLYTFEDLAAMANENMRGRLDDVELCRSDITGRVARLWDELLERGSGEARAADCEQDRSSRAGNPA